MLLELLFLFFSGEGGPSVVVSLCLKAGKRSVALSSYGLGAPLSMVWRWGELTASALTNNRTALGFVAARFLQFEPSPSPDMIDWILSMKKRRRLTVGEPLSLGKLRREGIDQRLNLHIAYSSSSSYNKPYTMSKFHFYLPRCFK